MPKVVARIIAGCRICAAAKYERNPEQTPQMLTPTPAQPLDVVEADVMFWAGLRVLTMMDRLTRFAFAHQLTNKTAAEVCTGLLSFFGTVGLPGTLVVDRGREFHNARVKSLLEELGIVHWTTPGHPRSHGMVERLHSTLLEHLHLLRIGRGIVGDEAWARALLAYNNSVHSATGRTPLELMRSWQQSDPPVSADERRKSDRVDRANEKATDRWDRVRVGDQVFLRNWYRRRKSDPRFVGPYVVASKLRRYRIRVRDSATGRTRVVHVRETRPPSAKLRVPCGDPAIGRSASDSEVTVTLESSGEIR
ncbi:hypothetical protein AAG570_009570 [Ranatra chinensis]|uniref:Integrase catalytic domain-containing protein n=1 Tax=Ranatra chinensis TaxID=642074 RepID=A0ABD0YPG4_9HEMI